MDIPWDLERFDLEWQKGSRERARQLAIEYIKAHFDAVAPHLKGKSIGALVSMIDRYREKPDGDGEANRIIIDMWLIAGLAESGPAVIGTVELGCADPLYLLGDDICRDLRDLQQEWNAGRRTAVPFDAKRLSERYPEILRQALGRLTIEELTTLTDQYREEQDGVSVLAVNYWILGQYDQQHIVGTLAPGMRGALGKLLDKHAG